MDQTPQGRFVEELVHIIDDITQCPVCLERAQSPVSQCLNGHITCGQCKSQQTKCPLCGSPFITTPPRILEQLLQVLFKPCKYAKDGCTAPIVLNSHERFCLYRPIKCWLGPDNLCQWTGSVKDWIVEHILSSHEHFMKELKTSTTHTFIYKDFSNWISHGYCYIDGKTLLVLYAFKHNNVFYQTVKVIYRTRDIYLVDVSLMDNEKVVFQNTFEPTDLLENDSLDEPTNMPGVCISDIEGMIKSDGLPLTISIRRKPDQNQSSDDD